MMRLDDVQRTINSCFNSTLHVTMGRTSRDHSKRENIKDNCYFDLLYLLHLKFDMTIFVIQNCYVTKIKLEVSPTT